MKASSIAFPAAVVIVIIGMAWGIHMAASQNHVTSPAHAHLNLLGWVSLFLMGVFYRLHPALDRSMAAVIQVVVWIVASVVLVTGVGIIYAVSPATGEPFATAGSLLALADMVLFLVLVVRGIWGDGAVAAA